MSADFDFVKTELAPGLSVIEASAGTGKTYAISPLVPRLLLDKTAANLGEILLVTFTNDAARELSDRVRRVLEKLAAPPVPDEETQDNGLHRLREKFGAPKVQGVAGRALLDLDLLGVSTIHSFCQKTLQTEGTLCGLPVVPELIPDAADIVEQTLYDIWETRIASNPLHAAAASAMKWEAGVDLKFLKFALPLQDAVPVPDIQNFEKELRKLAAYPKRFTEGVCAEFSKILEGVTTWTDKDPGEGVRSQVLRDLRESGNANDPGFLDAVRHVAATSDWINGSKHKALKAEAAACRVVALACEMVTLLNQARWNFLHECLAKVRPAVDRALAANRQITYDGLIGTLYDALRGNNAGLLAHRLRSRYKVALIDESQDTDDRQFEIFKKIFVGFDGEEGLDAHRLVLIGDPKQAIYAFRGADVNTYLGAKELAGGEVFPLTKTYRSPEPLVRATNALFSRSGSLLKDDLGFQGATSGLEQDLQLVIEENPGPARMECWIVPDGDGTNYSNDVSRSSLIADTVASEVVRILHAKAKLVQTKPDGSKTEIDVRPSDFAVLVSDGRQAAAVADALFARSVPAIRAGADDIMASDEAEDLLAILRALTEPRRSGLRLATLASRMLGLDSSSIRAADENDEIWLEKMMDWQAVWQCHGIAAALTAMDSAEGITARLASFERGERRVTNFRQLTDLLEAASLELGNHPGHLVRWLAQEVARAEDRSMIEERQQQLESDAEAVQIVTMHSAKGLEYPLVFCPFLWSSKKPRGFEKLSIKGECPKIINIDLADDSDKAAIAKANLEDRLRLAYVAVTRAQAKVWIYGGEICGSRNRPPASALDWLLRSDQPPDFSAWTEAVAKSGRGTRHLAGLEALAQAGNAEEVIAWKEPPAPDAQRWQPAAASTAEDIQALKTPAIPHPWGMTSFSALTREKNPHAAPDAGVPKGSPEPTAQNPFFDAPGGTLVGTAVHDWIEQWDFSQTDPTALTAHLSKYPFAESSPPFAERVGGMLEALRAAKLPGLNCMMQEACPQATASEWHFQLPIHGTLGADSLARVFAAHGQSEYAAILGALPTEQLQGYLHGFLDRIAFHHGSWGVIDWKTNKLGLTSDAYLPASLMQCAIRSHYLLQAHLYLVALRRFLGPEAKIAGAWLVFLRGVASGTDAGILHIQPEDRLLTALDGLFAPPSAP